MGLFNSKKNHDDSFLTWFEKMKQVSHRERIRNAAKLGHKYAGTEKAEALFDFLAGRHILGKILACQIARHAGMPDKMVPFFSSESITVVTSALNGWFGSKNPGALPPWETLSRTEFLLREFSRRAMVRNRSDLLDQLIVQLLEHGREDIAANVLPGCSEPVVRQYLTKLAEYGLSWSWMVEYHPQLALEYITEKLKSASESTLQAYWSQLGKAIVPLMDTHSEVLLDILLENGPKGIIPIVFCNRFKSLIRDYPEKVEALLTRPQFLKNLRSGMLPPRLIIHLKKLPEPTILLVAKQLRQYPPQVRNILKTLSFPQRGRIFEAIYYAEEGATPNIPSSLLEVLPRQIRYREARKMLLRYKDTLHFQERVNLYALLPFEEGLEELKKYGSASDEQERGQALAGIMRLANTDRKGFPESLAYLKKIKNDQDPVRILVWNEIANFPLASLKEEHLPAIQALIDPIYEARDSSWGVFYAIQRFFEKLIREYGRNAKSPFFKFALGIFKVSAEKRGSFMGLPHMEKYLNKEQVEIFVNAIKPALRWQVRIENHSLVFSLGTALGKWVKSSPAFMDLVQPLVWNNNEYTARQAIEFWLRPPKTREKRVRELLDKEPSAIVIHSVFMTLHRYRQDWLDPFISGKYISGRFLTGMTVWVPSAPDGFYRWTPDQQNKLKAYYLQLFGENQRLDYNRVQAVKEMGKLYMTEAKELGAFLKDQRQLIREAAMGGMARLDRPGDALPYFLKYLDRDEARVAMYAIPRSIRFVSRETGMQMVEELLQEEYLKITVRKELVRLLGALRLDLDGSILWKEWNKEKVHKDVQIAIGHAARSISDTPKGFELLEEIAKSDDPDIVRSLIEIEPTTLTLRVQKRYIQLLSRLATHPDIRVRSVLFSFLPRWKYAHEEMVFQICMDRLRSPLPGQEDNAGIRILMEIAVNPEKFVAVLDLIQELISIRPEDQTQEPKHDLPFYRRVKQILADIILHLSSGNFKPKEDQLIRLKGLLAPEPVLQPELLRIKASITETSDANIVSDLISIFREVEEAGWTSEFHQWIHSFTIRKVNEEKTNLLSELIEKSLGNDPALERIALLMLQIWCMQTQWSDRRREYLKKFRASSHPVVRRMALDITLQ